MLSGRTGLVSRRAEMEWNFLVLSQTASHLHHPPLKTGSNRALICRALTVQCHCAACVCVSRIG